MAVALTDTWLNCWMTSSSSEAKASVWRRLDSSWYVHTLPRISVNWRGREMVGGVKH